MTTHPPASSSTAPGGRLATRARAHAAWQRWLTLVCALCALVAQPARAIGLHVGYFNNYLPSEIEANLISLLAERYPSLGVASAEPLGSDVTPAWVGLQRGDTDVLVEVDLPNQQALLDKASGTVATVTQLYTDAGEGFFVPAYVTQGPGAPAPTLHRIDELTRYANLFGATLYDESPGWQTTKDNALRLNAYGIPFKQVALSDAALIATVKRAATMHQPIVFFFSHPHWLFRQLALQKLDEPAPFHPGCFQHGDDRCALPSFSAGVGARKDLATRAPRFYRTLAQMHLPITDIEAMMYEISIEHRAVRAVASAWLDAHRALADGWVHQAGG